MIVLQLFYDQPQINTQRQGTGLVVELLLLPISFPFFPAFLSSIRGESGLTGPEKHEIAWNT
jgi:hypothetical protein